MSSKDEPESASKLIDARIEELPDWQGEMLSRIRGLIRQADPDVVEEWKWRGVPVWRAIDLYEGDEIDEIAFASLVRAAVAQNEG